MASATVLCCAVLPTRAQSDGKAQIGFLTEWQLYAQKIEGDSWVGEKLDAGKIEKMSGACSFRLVVRATAPVLTTRGRLRRTAGPVIRADASNTKEARER